MAQETENPVKQEADTLDTEVKLTEVDQPEDAAVLVAAMLKAKETEISVAEPFARLQSEVSLQKKGKEHFYEDEMHVFHHQTEHSFGINEDASLALGSATLAHLFSIVQTHAATIQSQQHELASLRLYLAHQSRALSNQRAKIMARLDNQAENVRSFKKTFI